MDGVDEFEHRPEHRILRCARCRYAVPPQHLHTHLRRHHPTLTRSERAALLTQAGAIEHVATTALDVVYPTPDSPAISGFAIYLNGLACRHTANGIPCHYVCLTIKGMQDHCRSEHHWRNHQLRGGNKSLQKLHTPNKMWDVNVSCQRFFREPRWMRYFEVLATLSTSSQGTQDSAADFFAVERDDILQAKIDAVGVQNRVDGFAAHHSTVVPWLQKTGIATHIEGLSKEEIRSAIALPDENLEATLTVIVQALEKVLRRAHASCFDGNDCLLTWACQVALNRFQAAQIEGIGRTRAFEPNKQEKSLKRYFDTMKRFVCYLSRVAVASDGHFTRDGDRMTPGDMIQLDLRQRHQWRRVNTLATEALGVTSDGEGNCRDRALEDELVNLLISFISQDIGARRYSSPIVSFCAMLAIKPSTGSWMEPGNFNSHLSAIIWVVQLLIFHYSAEQERAGNGKTIDLVKAYCDKYLQQTVETPMGELLRWRLLLFHVSQNTVSEQEASWDEDEEVLIYHGQEFHLNQFPTLAYVEFRECERLLYEDLLLGNTQLRRMDATALKDNAAVQSVGWSFISNLENEGIVGTGATALLDSIAASDHLRHLYTENDDHLPTHRRWRESALVSYEGTVQRFLEGMCALWHILSGQPLREPEFLSITWKNTQRKRSITIQHKRVMIHTQYDKSQQTTGNFKENVRFLPRGIGDMLLDYLVYVQPLRQTFLRHHRPGQLLSPFLWEKGGAVWPESRLSYCLERASVRAQMPRLHSQNWRQMTVAIVKTKFASDIGVFQPDEKDEDGEEMDSDIRAMTRQRNHKTRTVNRAYANQNGASFGGVWDGMIRMGLRASTLWQDFWGADLVLRSKKRKRHDEDTRLSKRVALGIYRPKKAWSSDALLAGMRQLFRQPDMEWKSAEQCQAMTMIMSWSEQIVAILPTGAGKSMLFLVPCSLPGAATTILIVPLVALRSDLLRRTSQVGISALEWLPGERREAAFVIVSVEAAGTNDFMTYAQHLVARQRLDRVVVDECHLTVTAIGYRESLSSLGELRALRTQFVYLTATLPPSMWSEFAARNYLVEPRVVRASSNRPNIFYMVRKAVSGKGGLLEQAAEEARVAWSDPGMFDHARDKVILYARTRAEAEALAGLLRCGCYTSQSGSALEKQKILDEWTADLGSPYLVATTALAEGFDYPYVRLVVNVGEPGSLVLFAQESGRAGRDGRAAYSLVLLPESWQISKTDEDFETPTGGAMCDASLRKSIERRAMGRYLEGAQCFRLSLSEHLDSPSQRRWCMEDDYACDICGVGHTKPAPRVQPENAAPKQYTGLDMIQKKKLRSHLEVAGYVERLSAVHGTCLYCRMLGRRWDHTFADCTRRTHVLRARRETLQRHEDKSRKWLQPYTACYFCLNPQVLCARVQAAGPDKPKVCDHRDIVLPLCCGVYESVGGPRWVEERFGREFGDMAQYLDWIGEETTFGEERAIQAVRVAAAALAGLDELVPVAEEEAKASDEEWLF